MWWKRHKQHGDVGEWGETVRTRKIYFDQCAAISGVNRETHYTPGPTWHWDRDLETEFLMRCSTFPDDIKFKPITKADYYLYISRVIYDHTTHGPENAIGLSEMFDPNTVTYATKPRVYNGSEIYGEWYRELVPGYMKGTIYDWDFNYLRSYIKYGVLQEAVLVDISTPNGRNKPYLELTYDDQDAGILPELTYPVSGATVPPSIDTKFTWSCKAEASTLESLKTRTAKLRWRVPGQTAKEIDVGTAREYTVPGGTFLSGFIEWQIELTANSDVVKTSQWERVEVKEPVPSTTLIAPKNTIIDAAAVNKFEWSHIIETGTKQKQFEMQTSPNGSGWATFRTGVTSDTFMDVAPDTLQAGDLYWRVRTYNTDGVPGDWSEPAHCIVIAAPKPPTVVVTDTAPKFAVRWQQTGQQAYELQLDGATVAKRFGTETDYTSQTYLEPGTHIVRVRIQNHFSLWSEWGETVLEIVNQPGEQISLAATATKEHVSLSWVTKGTYDTYLIFRNGKPIAETVQRHYTDQFALGLCKYVVYGIRNTDGYFTQSTEQILDVTVPEMMIAEVDHPVWLSLALSTSELRSTSWSASASVTFLNYVGHRLPYAEVGEHENGSYMLIVSWRTDDLASQLAFERLRGKPVCLKTPYGRRVIGVIASIDCIAQDRFTTSYSATITETEADL